MNRGLGVVANHLEALKNELQKLNADIHDTHFSITGALLLASIRLRKIPHPKNLEVELRNSIFANIKNERAKASALGGDLFIKSLEFLGTLDATLNRLHDAIVFSGNVERVFEDLKKEIGHVDHVIVYDCLSVPEFLVIASKISKPAIFLDTILINPPGKTRYVGEQGGRYLRHYAQKLGMLLNAQNWIKESRIDLTIHEKGSLPLDQVLESINVHQLLRDIQKLEGTVLITTDHGYDVGISGEGYPYVEHGIKNPLVNFSKIAPFLIIGEE